MFASLSRSDLSRASSRVSMVSVTTAAIRFAKLATTLSSCTASFIASNKSFSQLPSRAKLVSLLARGTLCWSRACANVAMHRWWCLGLCSARFELQSQCTYRRAQLICHCNRLQEVSSNSTRKIVITPLTRHRLHTSGHLDKSLPAAILKKIITPIKR